MDPLAHTLVGASLAESGLKRATPLATLTLVLGANAPDIDVLSAVWGGDAALEFRRGITHGLLAVLVLPVVLTGVMLAVDRARRRRHPQDATPARADRLLLLAFLSVLSHPLLDWLNTYGVRLLSPFDTRWFYGDAVFIVDPWIWLLGATPVVLARTRRLATALFALLGVGATCLILVTSLVPLAAKVTWCVALSAIVGLRLSARAREHASQVARVCLGILLAYVLGMVGASRLAREDARAWLWAQGIAVDEVSADLLPGNPFGRDVIARAGDTYYFVRRSWLGDGGLGFSHAPIPVGPRNAITRAALAAPQVRGMRAWLRYPSFDVARTSAGYRVTIRDVRYSRTEGARIGTALVELDGELQPR